MLKRIYRILESRNPKFSVSPSEFNRWNGGVLNQEYKISEQLTLPDFFSITR